MSKGLDVVDKWIKIEQASLDFFSACGSDTKQTEKTLEELKRIKQELKALEIIKNKNVQVDNLLYMIHISTNPREDYNRYGDLLLGDRENKQLTQEEYDLLKEVWKDENI